MTSAKRHGDENERFSCIAGKQDYARLLDTCEIIVPERRNYYIETVYSHYEHTMQEASSMRHEALSRKPIPTTSTHSTRK